MNNGIGRIVRERKRHFYKHGWTLDHDLQHDDGEMERAATLYAETAAIQARRVKDGLPALTQEELDHQANDFLWPDNWDTKCWKPSLDPVRNLEKAGALIAAAIDRHLEARRLVAVSTRTLGYNQEKALAWIKEHKIWDGVWKIQGSGYNCKRDTARVFERLGRRGLVEKNAKGAWQITDAGMAYELECGELACPAYRGLGCR